MMAMLAWAVVGAAVMATVWILRGRARGALHRLKNGLEVHCWLPEEADLLYHELYVQDAYTHPEIDYSECKTIVDVGANIGMFAIRAMERAPDARVLSIEPVHAVWQVLQRNLAKFGRRRATAVNYGVACARQQAQFRFHPNFSIWSTADAAFDRRRSDFLGAEVPQAAARAENLWWLPGFVRAAIARWFLRKWGAVHMVDVTLVPLSDILDEQGVTQVDLLKVDVEGHELEVLRSIHEEHWEGIRQVVMEVEDSATQRAVEELLRDRGLTVETKPSALKDLLAKSELVDLYAWRPQQ